MLAYVAQFRHRDGHVLAGGRLLLGEGQAAVCVGRAGVIGLAVAIVVVRTCRVEGELHTRQRFAVLVLLDDAADRDVHQVVFQPHVGVGAAALQVEEVQRVGGAVGEGIAVEALRSIDVGGRKLGPERRLINGVFISIVGVVAFAAVLVDHDIAGRKVDLQGGRVVDAAQVAHQHAVDKDPHVVVAGEIVGDGFAAGGLAAVLLHELGAHMDAEKVVEGRAPGIKIRLGDQRAAAQVEHLVGGIEGEELVAF